jgi:hypothetical protein
MDQSPKAAARETSWSLEVVRGRRAGKSYQISSGESTIGNALAGQPGLDLKDQEGDSPRRMAGRHAAITATGNELMIRDLDSPGGTFVNRQRLLAGQTRRLEPGDLIQLGSVQLAVRAAALAAAAVAPRVPERPDVAAARPAVPSMAARTAQSPAPPPPTSHPGPHSGGRLAIPFTLPGGPTCRSWDDFLVLAAQEWNALRQELTSGRLSDFVRRAQRPDLLPRLDKNRSPDEQLDEWLARLPTTKPSGPELDVHPASLLVRVAAGGLMRQTVRVTNVGYRLLRSTVRIEPVSAQWLRISAPSNGEPFSTVDQTDLTIELDLPESLGAPLEAAILIDSNGGTRRIPVRVEKAQASVIPAGSEAVAAIGPELAMLQATLGEKLASVRPAVRVLWSAGGAIGVRLVILVAGILLHGAKGASLSSVALALVAAGSLGAVLLAMRQGADRDIPAAAFTGGSLGLLAAAICFAIIQTVERILGGYSTSVWAVATLWGVIGVVVALVSNHLIPHRPATGGFAP